MLNISQRHHLDAAPTHRSTNTQRHLKTVLSAATEWNVGGMAGKTISVKTNILEWTEVILCPPELYRKPCVECTVLHGASGGCPWHVQCTDFLHFGTTIVISLLVFALAEHFRTRIKGHSSV